MKTVLFVVWVAIVALFTAVSAVFSLPFDIVAPTAIILFGLFILSSLGVYLLRTTKDKPERLHKNIHENKVQQEGLDIARRDFFKALGALGFGALITYFIRPRGVSALSFGATGTPDPIGIKPLGNSQTTGSVTLTDANTWYQVPAANLTSRVFLVLQNRSGYDMYWSFDNTVSASTGGLLFPNGATLTLDANADVDVYVRCVTAAQACWYSESQSQ